MGKGLDGEKPKFDLVTVSKTKKYKIIFGIILGLGVLLLAGGFLMRNLVTSAVTPNALTIMNGTLSGLDGTGPMNYVCTISQDETFVLTTSTPTDRALANAIKFELDDNAATFLEVRNSTDEYAISSSNYQGIFYLHIKDTANANLDDDGYLIDANTEENVRPTGYLTIRCGSRALRIKFTYHKI